MLNNVFKIWGERHRILLDEKNEMDVLLLKKGTFCSKHRHVYKDNTFILISGKVVIETEFGNKVLNLMMDSFTVKPPLIHRFNVIEDSIMIEIASVKKGIINPDDIIRTKQGGRYYNGIEMTENELREKGMLEL